MDREKLILETFELSQNIGFRHFLAQNFNRDDPALTRLNLEERTAFLREWWDAARDRMYQEYRDQVAGLSFFDLLGRRQDYIEMSNAIGLLEWRERNAQGGSEPDRMLAEAKNERPKEPESEKEKYKGRDR